MATAAMPRVNHTPACNSYHTPDRKQADYIERARERAEKECGLIIKGRLKDGRAAALVASAKKPKPGEPQKFYPVEARRDILGRRVYRCGCKGMDPYGDASFQGFITCKHAEHLRKAMHEVTPVIITVPVLEPAGE